jgi:hypothetical protein
MINDLLKKGVQFLWTEVTNQAFQLLKQALISAHVLVIPNFKEQSVVETDASKYLTMAQVLFYNNKDNLLPMLVKLLV